MVATNRAVMICVVLLCAFALYKAGSGEVPLSEPFLNFAFMPAVDRVNQDGTASVPYNNYSSQSYDPNQVFPGFMSPIQKQTLYGSMAPPGSEANKQYLAGQRKQENYNTPKGSAAGAPHGQCGVSKEDFQSPGGCGGCSTGGRQGRTMIPPTFTVPGTYQAPLSPRFNSQGVNSFIRYNNTEEKYMANRANDPLMMADVVEAPAVHEGYEGEQKFVGNTPHDFQTIQQKLKKQGDEVFSRLPAPTGMGKHEQPSTYVHYDRFIFAPRKSYLYAAGDFIRGDPPCANYTSSPDPNCKIMFRPSASANRDLNPGAMFVMGGVYNTTAQQTAQLKMASAGGSSNTFAGVALPLPETTTVGALVGHQQQQLAGANLNMGNQISLAGDALAPLSTVTTTSFP